MSSPSPFGGRMAQAFPTLPKGETVASYESYVEAQSAVDRLAKAEFPVKELAIVGTDLTSVERITGKLTWGRVAGGGALSGAWFGLFLGLLFFIFAPSGATLGILGAAVLIGAGFGMIFGLVSYSVNRRRRDFTSVMQVLATRYAIIAEPQHVARAREVLGVEAPVAASSRPGAASPAGSAAPGGSTGDEAGPSATPAPPSEPADAAVGSGEGRPLTYGEAQDAERRARAQQAAARAAEERAARDAAARADADAGAEPDAGGDDAPKAD